MIISSTAMMGLGMCALLCMGAHECIAATQPTKTEDAARYTLAEGKCAFEYRRDPDRRPNGDRPLLYNWIARRDPCILVSGDLPRVALARTYRVPELNPPFEKLGDARVRVSSGGKSVWLDEGNVIGTRFYPWGTVHEVDLPPEIDAKITMSSFIAGPDGMGIKLDVNGSGAVDVSIYYGGIASKVTQNIEAPYFVPDAKDQDGDVATLGGSSCKIGDPAARNAVVAHAEASAVVSVESSDAVPELKNRALVKHALQLDKNRASSVRLLVERIDDGASPSMSMDEFDGRFGQAKAYYDALLEPFSIDTPDKAIDSAFYTSIVNLDYLWQSPAWLEGVHRWNSYFNNNYQITAAICLGQLDRARQALEFFADRPEGPGPTLNADGSSNLSMMQHQREEGLVYYVLELYQYWRATGDLATVTKLWEPTVKSIEHMFRVRDPEGNLLLNWHRGANMFLYQADHLALPGDAFSPTIMSAFVLDLMAEMGDAQGLKDQAAKWRHCGEYMRDECVRRLWLEDKGKFAAAIDTQGLTLESNYYTDFVYPQLYSTLPDEYSWISLRTLDRTLWHGDYLMRVGNFKPSLFGNDNVMPVQMTESAIAYFDAGRADRGTRLLHGAALASTVLTESPGSCPERLSDDGAGIPDFTFGNPAGAYVRSVVTGLFGYEPTSSARAMSWHPAIPPDWNSAELALAGVKMLVKGVAADRTYSISSDAARGLELRVPLNGCEVLEVTDGSAKPIVYAILGHPGGGFLSVRLEKASKHVVRVRLRDRQVPFGSTIVCKPKSKIDMPLPEDGLSVSDPQALFAEFSIKGKTLTGKLAEGDQPKTFFLRSKSGETVWPVDVSLKSANTKPNRPVYIRGKREAVDLSSAFNCSWINSRNYWRYGPVEIDIAGHSQVEGTRRVVRAGEFVFEVRGEKPNIAVIEVGDLNPYANELDLSDKPRSMSIPVGKAVKGVDFLTMAEMHVRMTGMEVGDIKLRYADGSCDRVPLVYGNNLDTMTGSFATEVEKLPLYWLCNASAFGVSADSSKVLDRVEIGLYATDGSVGLLAMNLIGP